MYDAMIAGAGPAGLQAALTLGRARRRVLLADGGPGRNAPSDAVHNVLSRDGIAPAELRRISLEQLASYESVEVRAGVSVGAVEGKVDDFRISLAGGGSGEVGARRLILATGVEDVLPAVDGLAPRWGVSVVHCPYCHGWERRDQPLAVLGLGEWSVHEAVHLRRFSDDVVLCTHDVIDLKDEQRDLLSACGVAVRESAVVRLEGDGTALSRLVFADGSTLARSALFCHPPTRQASNLPGQLGCTLLDDESVEINDFCQTSVPGVFAVGDMARRAGMPLAGAQVVIAAAEGAVAAVVADQELLYAGDG